MINQLNLAEGSWITGLAFSADNGDVIYDHIMFAKSNTTYISFSDEPEKKTAEITIITKDVDGQIISGAEVYLLNVSAAEPIVKSGITDSQGQIIFDNISYGVYDIIANYSLTTGLKKNVYNSSNLAVNHNIDSLYQRIYLKLDLWTLDFKVQDYDDKDLSMGYINVKESSGGQSLDNLSLDENGWQKFVWLNRSDYYYEAYYHNDDYNPIDTLINKGTVSRKTELINSTTVNVNDTNILSGQPEYKVDEVFLASGTNMTGPSTYEIGTQTIISANLSLQNMQDNLTSVRIWYIDENGNDDGSEYLLESKTYITETNDFLSYNLTGVKEAYGLRIEVIGQNQTLSNGIVTVSFAETQTIDITANMSSTVIYVTANDSPISEVIIKITNSSTGASIVDLITSSGYAVDSTGNPLWYLRGDYNISIIFFGNSISFNITNEVPTPDPKKITINTYTTLNVTVLLDPTEYRSAFSDTVGDQTVIWGENMAFQVNFTVSEDGGVSWNPITGSASVIYYVKTLSNTILDSGAMTPSGLPDGIYTMIYNSSKLVAGNDYKIIVFENAKGYTEPIPVTFFIKVNPVPTQLSVFNYVSQTNYTSSQESEYWNEVINFTVFYYKEGNFDAKLKDAELSYEWNFGSGPILQDPLKPEGYYYFELNTSDSPNVGNYQIKISAQLENYTTVTDFDFFIDILTIQTYINGKNTLDYISKNVYIKDAYNFTFEYTDSIKNNETIGDLDVATYTWNKLDNNGIPLNGSEYSGTGTLSQNPDKTYTIDFNTETREVGEYSIFITLHKSNYEVRNSLISLRINKRPITINLSATGFSVNQISVVQGTDVEFTLTLYNPTNGSQLLTSADITIKIGINEENMIETQEGVYTFSFSTENVEAFFMPVTLPGLITIEKEDYNTETIQLSIIVGMPEIFPGFPMFYFLMIVGAAIAVVGSLVAYRQILRARIPTFVKKVREMSKNIKGRKSISESLLYPSKDELIIKKLGDRWKVLGLSLDERVGFDAKTKKKLPETTEFKGGNE